MSLAEELLADLDEAGDDTIENENEEDPRVSCPCNIP